ncbi:hypothetical protein [Limimaricola sp. AA108-03]|uniref:hypothetical protein n=1 Tax=Limimaricola sp. AA108-03 TaxID=3425945 RepID=UPI003D784BE5
MAAPAEKLRKQGGFPVEAGVPSSALAAAFPQIGIDTRRVLRAVGDIGLDAFVRSNVFAILSMRVTAYAAIRRTHIDGHERHAEHWQAHLLKADLRASTAQALPYLWIIALFTPLTLPAPLRGLSPFARWLLLLSSFAYVTQALKRGRDEGEKVEWVSKDNRLAASASKPNQSLPSSKGAFRCAHARSSG